MHHIELDKKDKFLIIATDGVWDFLSDKEAVEIVAEFNASHPTSAGNNSSAVAQLIVDKVLQKAALESNMTLEELKSLPLGRARRGRHDDTTVVVMYF